MNDALQVREGYVPTTAQIAEEVTNGTHVLSMIGRSKLLIEIHGTATAASVAFKFKGPGGGFYPLTGVRLTDYDSGSTGGVNQVWLFETLEGIDDVQFEVSSVSGGSITITGRMM